MNIHTYRAKIDQLIREGTGEPALNGSHEHAAVVLERMFAYANESVRVLTKKFDPRTYCVPKTVEFARILLGDRGRSIKILVEEPEATNWDGNPYLNELRNIGDVEVRLVPEFLRGPISINFAVMDRIGYRLEEDASGATAVVSFGNLSNNDRVNLSERLADLFDQVWEQSSPYSGTPIQEAATG